MGITYPITLCITFIELIECQPDVSMDLLFAYFYFYEKN